MTWDTKTGAEILADIRAGMDALQAEKPPAPSDFMPGLHRQYRALDRWPTFYPLAYRRAPTIARWLERVA